MRIRIGIALLVLLLSPLLAATNTAVARQDASCEGIDEYIAELTTVGEQLETSILGDDSEFDSWTSEDFTAASDAIETATEDFDAIDPPAIAENYHAVLIQQFDLLAQMFDTMASAGVFGALLYIEPMDKLSVQVDAAAQAIEDACGVDIQDEFSGEIDATPVAVEIDAAPASPVVDTGDDATGASEGTRENPIPVGETARIHPDWEMTVISVTPDATDLIVTEDSFNEPPAAGHQFFLATVRLTYVGETSDEFYVSDLSAVGQSAVGYDQFIDYCGSIPNALPSRELFTGGTIEGNVCWSVAVEDADSLVLYDDYGDKEERVYLSMMPGGLEPATPVAAVSERS